MTEKEEYITTSRGIWLPPLVLLVILSLVLVYLLIPGNLILFNENKNQIPNLKQSEIDLQIKSSLEKRINELETALEGDQCIIPNRQDFGNTKTVLPPLEGDAQKLSNVPLLLPPPSQIVVQMGEKDVDLAELLKRSVVLLLSEDGESHGTGFFVNNNHIVTNAHVVPDGTSQMLVFENMSSEPKLAAVIDKSAPFEISNQDYAVLLSSQPSEWFLTFSDDGQELQMENVLAAGFPGDFIETTIEFNELGTSLDTETLPFFVTNGIVNAEQEFKDNGALIIHSADISQGNSGGPLVNSCGKVVGINTFVRPTEIRTLNIALRSDALKQFLMANSVDFSKSERECSPEMLNKPIEGN